MTKRGEKRSIFTRIGEYAKNHKTAFALIVAAVFILIQIPVIFFHEPFMDEATPWQMAKEIDVTNFYEVNRSEPHPMLWQLLLAPFAKLGFPFVTIHFISLAVTALAVFLMVRNAPLKWQTRVLLALSAGFFYYNSVISRDYCLVALALMAIASCYKTRLEHPIRYALSLALLTQSHFIMMPVAILLMLGFIFDYFRAPKTKRRPLGWLFLAFAPIALSVASSLPMIIGSLKTHPSIQASSFTLGGFIGVINASDKAIFGINAPIFELFLIACGIFLLVKDLRLLVLILASFFTIPVTMSVFYNSLTWSTLKFTALPLGFFFVGWLYLERSHKTFRFQDWLGKKIGSIQLVKRLAKISSITALIFTLPLLLSVPNTVYAYAWDYHNSYDYETDLADTIKKDIAKQGGGKTVIMIDSYDTVTLYGAMPAILQGDDIDMYNASRQKVIKRLEETTLDDDEEHAASDEEFLKIADEVSKNYDHVYYMAAVPSCGVYTTRHLSSLLDAGWQEVGVLKTLSTRYLYPLDFAIVRLK